MNSENDKKDRIHAASRYAVGRVSSRLGVYFNHRGNCLCQTWSELANVLGLSQGDVPRLKELVASRGLSGPKRS